MFAFSRINKDWLDFYTIIKHLRTRAKFKPYKVFRLSSGCVVLFKVCRIVSIQELRHMLITTFGTLMYQSIDIFGAYVGTFFIPKF